MSDTSGGMDRQARLLRWRLLLGEASAEELDTSLSREEQRMDAALAALYDAAEEDGIGQPRRSSGLGSSAPRVARWLGDIRTYFPTTVVQVMQRDAIERLHLTSMLLEPELLDSIQPDVHLVSSLVSLSRVMPDSTKRTARVVVGQVVAEIERRIANKTRAAVTGAVSRASRTRRPRPQDIDWNATIRRNLDHYIPEQRTIIPERLVGYGRGANAIVKEVVVAIDQSGSMAESLVYAAVFGATLASIRSLKTSVVAFDTQIADLTEKLSDPVDVLFGCQLGGGTDINRALAYCQQLITRPTESILVLISDLYEGGIAADLLRRVADLLSAGVTVIALLALSDSGAPAYDHEHAAALAALGVPSFACTPDQFPDLLAVAISKGDIGQWHATVASEAAAAPRLRSDR
ncbi:MAG TPA: VWA domain-containing protein [Propionibacteriaceae bacterium]|nr:VWA domain-containing protein [Propionibacteriaceae bacterium]